VFRARHGKCWRTAVDEERSPATSTVGRNSASKPSDLAGLLQQGEIARALGTITKIVAHQHVARLQRAAEHPAR